MIELLLIPILFFIIFVIATVYQFFTGFTLILLIINAISMLAIFLHYFFFERQNKVLLEAIYTRNDIETEVIKNTAKAIIAINGDKIIWFNKVAKEIFPRIKIGIKLQTISKILSANKNTFEYTKDGQIYSVVKNSEVFFLTNITDQKRIAEKELNSRPVVGYIEIDSMDTWFNKLTTEKQFSALTKINNALNDFAQKWDVSLEAVSQSKWTILTNHKSLEKLIDDEFSIVYEIKKIGNRNYLPLSISIGASYNEEITKITSLKEESEIAFNNALNRGGNQAIVTYNGEEKIFTYDSNPLYDSSKTKTRVFASHIEREILDNDRFYIISHKKPDMDSLASQLAMYELIKAYGKEVTIIANFSESSFDAIKALDMYTEEREINISKKLPTNYVKTRSVLFVMDTNNAEILYKPTIIRNFTKIIIIDHHIKSISRSSLITPLINYTSINASSTVELIVELFDFMKSKIIGNDLLASIMLAGVIVDTKNFTQHTTPRTFSVAAKLHEMGASTQLTNTLEQRSVDELKIENEIIYNGKIYNKNIFISIRDQVTSRETAVIACSKMKDTEEINYSFVITYINKETVFLTARSKDQYNVQFLIEKLGGGGHKNMAALTTTNYSPEELKIKLFDLLDINEENENEQ